VANILKTQTNFYFSVTFLSNDRQTDRHSLAKIVIGNISKKIHSSDSHHTFQE